MAEQSRSEGNDQQARLVEQAADRGERLSAYLKRADGEQMLAEAEDFARRQPWVIAGAGLAVGLVVARALKASSGTRYQQRYATAYSAQSTHPRRYEAGQAPQPAYVESPSRSFGNGEGDDRRDGHRGVAVSSEDRNTTVPLDRRDESTAELVKDLLRDVSELVHQEIELARVEMTEKGKKAGLGLGLFGGSAAFALVTLGGSMATIVILLDMVMPLWLAALITTVVYGVVAAVLALRGRDELKQAGAPIPGRTRDSIKEDIQWAKTRAQSKDR